MGLFSYLRGLWAPEIKIIFFGYVGAGKTTLLYKLKLGEVVTTIRTTGFYVENLTYKNRKFIACDLRRDGHARGFWPLYYVNTDAIIYVVDSADRDSLEISKDELWRLLRESELANAVLLVLANKQDLANCLTVDEVHQALNLDALCDRTHKIFKTSVITGEGLNEAMDWLCNAVQNRK